MQDIALACKLKAHLAQAAVPQLQLTVDIAHTGGLHRISGQLGIGQGAVVAFFADHTLHIHGDHAFVGKYHAVAYAFVGGDHLFAVNEQRLDQRHHALCVGLLQLKYTAVLKINHLSVAFSKYETFFKKNYSAPIEDLSLSLEENTITAVVGQSGSGKSLVAHAIMGMLPGNCRINGELLYKGTPFTDQVRRSLRKGEIVIIPQSIDYLDPLMTVGNQIRELVREGDPEEEMQKILARYSLAPEVADMYPFELSGGMARRILIACAVVQRPALIIADEPTPGLDEELVDEAIGHMLQLKENGASLLVITHDLFVAQAIADKIVFFKDGKSACQVTREEFANTSDFENLPPYAKLLFESLQDIIHQAHFPGTQFQY